jgi:hypothetical protein
MYRKNLFYVLTLLLLAGWLAACQPAVIEVPKPTSAFPAEIATSWFDLQLKLIQETPGFTPPVASRALGYSAVALYEAVVIGMPQNQSLVGQLNELDSLPQPEAGQAYDWAAVANSALATSLRRFYPTATPENLAAINALEAQYAGQRQAEVSEPIFNRSAAYGQAAAEAIFAWSTSDGGHEGYLRNFPDTYAPPQGTGMWVATPPNYQAALQPHWGQNRPFVVNPESECLPPPPTTYSDDPASQFYAEGMAVYTAVNNLTPDQEQIALFWADDPGRTFTPPGHSIAIANQVLQQEQASLALAAEVYARVGIAISDSFISCWNTKYIYNLIRPITYIQAVIDPGWNTPDITDPVMTPPFPEYTSGHSVQSGAAATVLTAVFGDNYQFSDNSHTALGLPARTYNSFHEFADEAAISRLYGGIHYLPAIQAGLDQGRCIGEQVNGLAWKK